MAAKKRKEGPRYYRKFVEAGLAKKPRNPFQKVYGGVILGEKKFIEEVLDRLNDRDVQKKEIAHKRSPPLSGVWIFVF
jgi:hypothetical protein